MIVVGEKFEIIIQRFGDSKKFKMRVECIYVSEQVLRFKITWWPERNDNGKTFIEKDKPMEDR
jgi:hypothetical protein